MGVELRVSGSCPGEAQPLQLMIVYDTSRSMNWGYALAEARQSTLDLLGRFNPQRVEVGAVSFNDQAALVSPLTRDLATLGRQVVALSAVGDTQLSGALKCGHSATADGGEAAGCETGHPHRHRCQPQR